MRAPELASAFRTIPTSAACAVCGRPKRSTIIDAHHILPAQVIRLYASEHKLSGRETTLLMWDLDNRLLVCRRCHDRHETGTLRIPLDVLPPAAITFAEKLGLGWRLDRLYARPLATRGLPLPR